MKRRFFYLKVIFFIYFPYIAFSFGNLREDFCVSTGLSSHNSINYYNPSLIPFENKNIININISPGLFNMTELQQNEIYSKFNIIDNLFVSIGYAGINNNLFSENNGTFGFAYKFSPIFQLGIDLNYNNYTVTNFSSINSFKINIGGRIKLDEQLYAGFVLQNVNRSSRIENDNNPEQSAKFGLAYLINDNFTIEAESNINISKSNSFSFASKYDIEKIISLRIAFLTEPQTVTFGANYNLFDNYYLNYDINKNNNLGYSHFIGLSILW